ncbi:MAG: DUF6717 family protein [Bacteroidota bacterium]
MKTTNELINLYNSEIPGRKLMESTNSILVINPFFKNGMWVFNDNRTGLIEEPFVAGADIFIEHLLKKQGKLNEAKPGFIAIFSKIPFPGNQAVLSFKEFKDMGTIYTTNETNFKNAIGINELWLCPALNLYFKESPEKIYVEFRT